MAGERTVKVRFTGDESDLKRSSNAASSDLGKLQNDVSNLNRAAMVASTAILVGITAFVAQGAASLVNMERLNAQTTQAIKSTNAAWADTSHIVNYTEKIERLTGIEHENVQEGANLLLTFTNIQNRVGAGNDVFDQATSILVDMSVAMGTDVKSSAIQLGKALNDPIKGITALTRVGVTFSEQQKKQIEGFVEAGNVMAAQKVILAELNKEFGGSAAAFGETTAGELAKLKNSFGDMEEELATAFSPALQKAFDIAKDFADWAKDNPEAFKNITLTVGGFALAVLAINAAIEAYKAVVALATAAQWAWNAAMLANPIGLLLLAIAAIIVGIGLIMAGFGFDWGEFWDGLKEKVKKIWHDITDTTEQFTGFMESIPGRLSNAFSSLGNSLASPFINAFNRIAAAWNATVGRLQWNLPAVLGGGSISAPHLGQYSARRFGGDVRAGMPYVVGDGSGPELFVPSTNGRIEPNPGEGGQWGGDTYVTVQVGNETIASVARAERVRAGRRTRRWVRAAQGSAAA
jgi:hypothetical protein